MLPSLRRAALAVMPSPCCPRRAALAVLPSLAVQRNVCCCHAVDKSFLTHVGIFSQDVGTIRDGITFCMVPLDLGKAIILHGSIGREDEVLTSLFIPICGNNITSIAPWLTI